MERHTCSLPLTTYSTHPARDGQTAHHTVLVWCAQWLKWEWRKPPASSCLSLFDPSPSVSWQLPDHPRRWVRGSHGSTDRLEPIKRRGQGCMHDRLTPLSPPPAIKTAVAGSGDGGLPFAGPAERRVQDPNTVAGKGGLASPNGLLRPSEDSQFCIHPLKRWCL